MNRNPKYFLDKAKYYNQVAKNNSYIANKKDYESSNETSDELSYEYIKLEPMNTTSPLVAQIKPQHRRYWDPITKHYYKIDKIFDDNAIIMNQSVPKDPDVWYPENKPCFQYMKDPTSGQIYKVNKIYNTDGNYEYTYDQVTYLPEKNPGTNYYRPAYRPI